MHSSRTNQAIAYWLQGSLLTSLSHLKSVVLLTDCKVLLAEDFAVRCDKENKATDGGYKPEPRKIVFVEWPMRALKTLNISASESVSRPFVFTISFDVFVAVKVLSQDRTRMWTEPYGVE